MPNGGPYGDDSTGRSREELTSASDIVIVAQKALKEMNEQEEDLYDLRKEVEKQKKQIKKLKATIKTLRALDKEE